MNYRSFCLLLLVMAFGLIGAAQQLRIATFNLRYDNPRDSGNLWVNRAPVVANLIRYHDFDVFGTQEGLKNQLDDIQHSLPQYAYSGAGRDDGKEKGEHSAIFYKTERFTLLKKGDFWLSETPEKPSMGWDGKCCYRICSWVYLQDKKTKKKFYLFNAHFDHEGIKARNESSKLVLKKINEIAKNEPVLLTGDLNGDQNSEWYKTIATSGIVKDTYSQVKYPYVNNTSFNGFGKQLAGDEIIDHVFATQQFQVQRWGLLTDSYHGKFPSDHFPVMVEMSLK
ncbi:endonuclease/exonuclease/phosphatase family protein [Flavisolibacter tropicus]|nr:endonuclease/exonuclease/phosphatase family protein [Flavisolibacter tropicus]